MVERGTDNLTLNVVVVWKDSRMVASPWFPETGKIASMIGRWIMISWSRRASVDQ
jgi:hypothetical protein